MKGNFHVQFLGEGVAATSPPYPTPGWATTQVYPARITCGRRADLLAAIADCDVFLCLRGEPSAEARFEVAAALGFGVPIITVASEPFSTAIAHESGEAGLCFPWDRGASSMARPLSEAMLRYLKEPDLVTAHRAHARRIFGARFHAAKAAAACSRSYVEACRSTRRPDQGSTLDLQDGRDSWSTRQSA